jgi:hypothetical protein
MKLRYSLLLVLCVLGLSGCAVCRNMSATAGVIDAAKTPQSPVDPKPAADSSAIADTPSPKDHSAEPDHAHPAYYLFIPLSVPFDIVTFPIQAVLYYGFFQSVH